ncbi:MAG: polyprenyl synthetase family protein [Egibacteraceae bacterium]
MDGLRSVAALDAVHCPVDALLGRFMDARIADLAALDPALAPIGREVAGLVRASGKRLRPAFVYWGHRATGAEHLEGVLGPAGAVELLHTFALIHDDVMDRSAERRGRPAVHEALARTHFDEGLTGDARWFGMGGAILAGDLAFVWADQLLDTASLPPETIERARRVFTQLRVEVMAGQYLDLRLTGREAAGEGESLRVALLKSGRYTVTRPLQLGAAIGGGEPTLDATLREYGDATGLAFQLRDDVLGLFGDHTVTGKGALSDLREGKRTVLMLRAFSTARPPQRQVLVGALGNAELDDETADRVREIVTDCGALDAVEALVAEQLEVARAALGPLGPPAREALEELADFAAHRTV